MVDFVPLDKLRAGQEAEILGLTGDPSRVHRLQEFGLRSGTSIAMFRSGNPCIIRLAGSKVCIRMDDSLQVMVKPVSTHG